MTEQEKDEFQQYWHQYFTNVTTGNKLEDELSMLSEGARLALSFIVVAAAQNAHNRCVDLCAEKAKVIQPDQRGYYIEPAKIDKDSILKLKI